MQAHLSDKRIQDCFRFGGPFIHDLSRRSCSHHRLPNPAGMARSSARESHSVCSSSSALQPGYRVSEGGTVQVSRSGVQQVAEDQPDGSADHRGRRSTGANTLSSHIPSCSRTGPLMTPKPQPPMLAVAP